MTTLHYKNGNLHMENADLSKIAERCGTPVYCYSTERIADNFHAWQSALHKIIPSDNFTICYALKANSNLAVVRLLSKLGCGADVVSIGEMYRAFKTAIPAKKIVFSGVGKKEVELTRAIKNDVLLINAESESEMSLISKICVKENKEAHIAFRINPGVDAKTHAKITTGMKHNKFGIDIENALFLYHKAASMPGILPTGISIHIGSQLTDLAPFKAAFKSVADLVIRLRDQGNTITTVDLGGGLGITYKDETPPALDEYAALIRDIILPLKVHVIVEPGRSIVGDAGVLLTRIVHTKTSHGKKFLIVDAGMNDLMRPALYGACHPIIPYNEPSKKQPVSAFDVVGPVCETSDTFLTDGELPGNLAQNDLLAITVAGAYGASMSSNYNTRPSVMEALVSDEQFDMIRTAQKMEDLVNTDIIPEWLA